jgi:hypothetical protein
MVCQHVLMTSSMLADDQVYSTSRILVAQEYSSLSVCASFVLKETSIRFTVDDRVYASLSFIGIVSVSQGTVWSLKFMIMPNFPNRSLPQPIIISYVFDDSRIVIFMKCTRRTLLFLEIGGGGTSQAYFSFSCSKFTTHCTPGGYITVISFDEWG